MIVISVTSNFFFTDTVIERLAGLMLQCGLVDYYLAEMKKRGAAIETQLNHFIATNVDRVLEARIFTRHLVKQ